MTNSHANCLHPATKAGRAACRKVRAEIRAQRRAYLDETITGYFDNSLDSEEIGNRIMGSADTTKHPLLIEARDGYLDNSLDIFEMICLAQRAYETL